MRKKLVFKKRIIGIYKSFVFWFGGACSFSSFALHFRYTDLEYLVFRMVADVVVKGSLAIGKS
jgi:hypothetical protein